MKELIILEGIDSQGFDEFMVVSGERIETETDPNFYPFTHAVTFRLCHRDAVRVGQKMITVAETAILVDCQLPKATAEASHHDDRDRTTSAEVPAVETQTAVTHATEQLTLFGDTAAKQLTLF